MEESAQVSGDVVILQQKNLHRRSGKENRYRQCTMKGLAILEFKNSRQGKLMIDYLALTVVFLGDSQHSLQNSSEQDLENDQRDPVFLLQRYRSPAIDEALADHMRDFWQRAASNELQAKATGIGAHRDHYFQTSHPSLGCR